MIRRMQMQLRGPRGACSVGRGRARLFRRTWLSPKWGCVRTFGKAEVVTTHDTKQSKVLQTRPFSPASHPSSKLSVDRVLICLTPGCSRR